MKTKNFLLSAILGIALSAVVLSGCKKDALSIPGKNTDITAAQDESNASDAINDSKNISDAAMQGNTSHSPQPLSPCIVKWSDTTKSSSDTIYVTFGSDTNAVYCSDGKWRQGEILIYWNKGTSPSARSAYWDSGSTITMTFRNYSFGNSSNNMIGVSGTRTLTNNGHNAVNQENWKFSASLTLTYNNGQTATWTSLRTNTLVQQDGVYYYQITGTAYGTSRNGSQYTVTITSPLYVTAYPAWDTVDGGCAYIESGNISINLPSYTLTINFGNVGACDNSATATIDGVNFTFNM